MARKPIGKVAMTPAERQRRRRERRKAERLATAAEADTLRRANARPTVGEAEERAEVPDRHAPGSLLGIERELDKLVAGLARDRLDGDRRVQQILAEKRDAPLDAEARLVAPRLELGRSALTRVISFLLSPAVVARWPWTVQLALHHHIEDVRSALLESEAGHKPDLFTLPAGRKKRVASPREEEYRGRVAAVAVLLLRCGVPSGEAVRRIAAGLSREGHRTAWGSKSERGPHEITGTTVAGWLKRATEAGKGTALREAFEGRLTLAEHRKAMGHSYASTAEAMMQMLAQDRPGSRLKKIRLAGESAPKK